MARFFCIQKLEKLEERRKAPKSAEERRKAPKSAEKRRKAPKSAVCSTFPASLPPPSPPLLAPGRGVRGLRTPGGGACGGCVPRCGGAGRAGQVYPGAAYPGAHTTAEYARRGGPKRQLASLCVSLRLFASPFALPRVASADSKRPATARRSSRCWLPPNPSSTSPRCGAATTRGATAAWCSYTRVAARAAATTAPGARSAWSSEQPPAPGYARRCSRTRPAAPRGTQPPRRPGYAARRSARLAPPAPRGTPASAGFGPLGKVPKLTQRLTAAAHTGAVAPRWGSSSSPSLAAYSAEKRRKVRKAQGKARKAQKARKSAGERGRTRESAGERGRARESAGERGRARKSVGERGKVRGKAREKRRGSAGEACRLKGEQSPKPPLRRRRAPPPVECMGYRQ